MTTDTDGQAGSKLLWTASNVEFSNIPTFHFVSNVIDFYSHPLNLFPGLFFSCLLHATQDNVFQVGVNCALVHFHYLEQNINNCSIACCPARSVVEVDFQKRQDQQIFTRPLFSGRPAWDLFSDVLSGKSDLCKNVSSNNSFWELTEQKQVQERTSGGRKTYPQIQFWHSRLAVWNQWQLLPQFSWSPEQQLPNNNHQYWLQ